VYSFTFTAEDTDNLGLIPSVIPQELWVAHIVPYLDKEKKALRASCRGFLFLLSQLWKPRTYFHYLNDLLSFPSQSCPQWPVQLYGIFFKVANSTVDLQVLTQLHNLKEIDFIGYREDWNHPGFLTDQDL